MTTLFLCLLMISLLFVAAPLFLLIGAGTIFGYLFFNGMSWEELTIAESMRQLTDQQPLLAVPFFVLAGEIMSRGAIATRLVNVARAFFGGLPGGLGIAAVIACMFFAAISGSSPVTVMTIGAVMYPALLKAGYDERFSTGLITSAGTLGILIPPSIPMIVYAIFASGRQTIQVESLFLAGIGPGLLIGLLLSCYCLWIGVRHGKAIQSSTIPLWQALGEGIWSLALPLLILGGIYGGLFTATEAAAVSVVYSLFVELFIHRSLSITALPAAVGKATVLMGSLLLIFAIAMSLNDLVVELELPDRAVAWIKSQELSPVSFMLLLNGFLLIVGCLMDILSAIMILVPLLAPMAASYGIDPVHLGVVFIVNLELGYLTPPMGLNLFVATTVFKRSLGEVVRSVLPFMGILLVSLLLVSYIPSISLGPVRLLEGKSFYVPFPDGESDEEEESSTSAGAGLSIEELMRNSGAFDEDEDEDEDGDYADDADDADETDDADKADEGEDSAEGAED
ncbi:MAG: TRAP transporter large permease subunit [Myxococcota bacterium]|nr:TRAP transporter large permease subunit [Myxococcota bacterium]